MLECGLEESVLLEPRNTYPFLRVSLVEKVHPGLWILPKMRHKFHNTQNLRKIFQKGLMQDIFGANGTHDVWVKLTHCWNRTLYLLSEYLPAPPPASLDLHSILFDCPSPIK